MWPDDQLAAYYSTAPASRLGLGDPGLSEGSTIVFDRRALSADAALPGLPDSRVQLRLERTPWTEGTDFLVMLSQANDKELIDWLGRWTDLLAQEFESGQPTPIDLLPHNLVALPDGRLRAIDSKFVRTASPRPWWRGGRWSPGCGCRGYQAEPLGAFTVEEVVRYIGTLIGLPADGSWITDAVAGEAAFQAEVSLHTPEPPTRAEAVALQEAVLWEELHLPLALSSEYNPGVGARIALEAELSRMGAAYGRLVDSHDALVSAHHTAVEGHAQQTAMLLGQLGTSQAELNKTRISLDAHVAEIRPDQELLQLEDDPPLRARSQLFLAVLDDVSGSGPAGAGGVNTAGEHPASEPPSASPTSDHERAGKPITASEQVGKPWSRGSTDPRLRGRRRPRPATARRPAHRQWDCGRPPWRW